MVPTWESPDPVRRQEVEQLGVTVHCIKPAGVGDLLRELGGPPVVSFCNPGFLTHYRRFKEHSPTVWVNCMTSISGEERAAWKKNGLPAAFVFQSEFQRRLLELRLQRHQYRQELGHLIRGAFCFDTWDFDPLARVEGEPFVVGRAARPDPSKWSSNTLEALDPVPNVRALFLGADERVRRQLGRRRWADMLAPGAVQAKSYYKRLHAMICYNSTAKENWPRVGLEAMATGVPLVVDGHWGWTEMVRHGETGFLAQRTSEFTEYLRILEADEALRHRIAQQARHSLETELANPDAIWGGWCGIWRAIGAEHLCDVTGPSPLAPSIENVRDLLAAQRSDDEALMGNARAILGVTEPPGQQFIASKNIELGHPVCWQDGMILGYPVVTDRSMEPLNPGDFMLARPGQPSAFRFDAKELQPKDSHEATEDTREQLSWTPETPDLQSRQTPEEES
jgi:glycosyltransferase involved in cell wall biosynthesis